MRWNSGEDSWSKKRRKEKWHKWFAWYPVIVNYVITPDGKKEK